MKTTNPDVDETRRASLAAMFRLAVALPVATGACAALAGSDTSEEGENIAVVNAYCQAWSAKDLSKPFAFLADDCVYRMTETTPPANGRQGISERLKAYVDASDSVEFRILQTFASGPIVINHRIDTFNSKTMPVTWEGVGVFFVKDRKIKEWSDYTIRVKRSVG